MLLDVCFINSLPVLQGFPWERHAPAWLPEPGWSVAFPGGTGTGLTKRTSSFALHFGHALALSGQVSASLDLLEQSVETAELTRVIGHYSQGAAELSEVYWLAGRYEEAQALAAQAYAHAYETQEHGSQAWTARLLGEMHAQGDAPDVEQAEAYYRQALTLAEALDMRPLQAHCHLGLGTLYTRTGQREQARAELFMAIGLYRAMDMHFWLPQAEAALAQTGGAGPV